MRAISCYNNTPFCRPTMSSIPTLDLTSDRHEAAKLLITALEDPGFLYIQNVKGYEPNELLSNIKCFFSLSEDTRMSLAKNTWNPNNTNRYRGYCPTIPGVVDFKEFIDFGEDLAPDDPDVRSDRYFYEPNVWLPRSVPGADKFKKFIMKYYQTMSELAVEVTHLLAVGQGKEEGYYDELFLNKPLSTLRFMHYPLRTEPIPEAAIIDGLHMTFLEHTDSVFATFLCTFYNKGLQIQLKNGSWIDIPVRPDCLVMNAGDALVRVTDRFKSTKHRVVDYGSERYSVPFFVEPSYTADISQYCTRPHSEGAIELANEFEEEPNQYGPWLQERLRQKNFTDFPKHSLD